jgi:hypothetical protein
LRGTLLLLSDERAADGVGAPPVGTVSQSLSFALTARHSVTVEVRLSLAVNSGRVRSSSVAISASARSESSASLSG